MIRFTAKYNKLNTTVQGTATQRYNARYRTTTHAHLNRSTEDAFVGGLPYTRPCVRAYAYGSRSGMCAVRVRMYMQPRTHPWPTAHVVCDQLFQPTPIHISINSLSIHMYRRAGS